MLCMEHLCFSMPSHLSFLMQPLKLGPANWRMKLLALVTMEIVFLNGEQPYEWSLWVHLSKALKVQWKRSQIIVMYAINSLLKIYIYKLWFNGLGFRHDWINTYLGLHVLYVYSTQYPLGAILTGRQNSSKAGLTKVMYCDSTCSRSLPRSLMSRNTVEHTGKISH